MTTSDYPHPYNWTSNLPEAKSGWKVPTTDEFDIVTHVMNEAKAEPWHMKVYRWIKLWKWVITCYIRKFTKE